MEYQPVTAERLPDLQRFSEGHGKFRYCSCMRWRMRSTDYKRSTKVGRVEALEDLVRTGTPVGVLAHIATFGGRDHRSTASATSNADTVPRPPGVTTHRSALSSTDTDSATGEL